MDGVGTVSGRRRYRRTTGLVAGGVGLALLAGLAPQAVAAPGVRQASAPSEAGEAGGPGGGADAAQAIAKQTGKSVEVTSLRGESSEVFATPEGNLEAREYLRPVRARMRGVWQPVDTGLVRAADGFVVPKVATVDLAFSGGGEAPLVRMRKAGRELALSWPEKLPVPETDGPQATYRNTT
ncbi:hypothetical protein ACIRRX_04680 [Streptomyces bacillaris]